MSWETALDRQIHDYLPDLKWAADEPMAKHTSFGNRYYVFNLLAEKKEVSL